MSNGPMGGFMPTPAAPAQPPPVKIDTTATSRGNFNNFLKSMNGASALTPLAPSGMGAMMPQSLAPSPTSEIDIFNEPVQMMHQGGTAGNPLSGYGDFLSNQISNTQVQPFIQEIEQMASQRFNLDNSGGLQQVGDGRPEPINNRLPQLGIFQPPPLQAEMGQPMRDKDGILRPGNPFQVPRIPPALDMQKELTGFMDFERGDINGIPAFDPRYNEQLLGSLPRTFDDGGQVQSFFSGGEIDSFVDEQDSGNNFSGGDNFDDGFTEEEDPNRAGDYQTDDSGIFTGGDDNKIPTVNFTNESIENAFNALNIPSKTQKELRDDLQDRVKNNDLIGALDAAQKDSAEFDSTSLGEKVLNNIIQASNVNPTDFSRKAFNQEDILGDKDVDALSLSKSQQDIKDIDPFDIQPTFQNFGLPGANLPNVKSTRSTVADDQIRALNNLVGDRTPTIGEQLQQNILEERGRALGPTTFSDDLANFSQNVVGQQPTVDTVFDIDTRSTQPIGQSAGVQELLDRGQKAQDIKNIQDALDRDILSQTLDQTTPTTTTSTRPEDFEEQVGLPFSDQRMRDIERLYNLPEGQRRAGEGDDPNFFAGIPSAFNVFETIPREQMAIDVALGRPRGLGEMFRGVTAPNLQNETMKQYTDRLQRNIIGPEGDTTGFSAKSIPESQLIRNNRGRITAITDASGRTMTGVNPDEQILGGDDSDPIIKRILPLKKEEEEEDKPPNVIGGIDIRPRDPLPTVVDSPFAPATSKIEPISFDSGELNKLIELLTGVPAKPVVSAAEGGLIRAVDDFLAIGR